MRNKPHKLKSEAQTVLPCWKKTREKLELIKNSRGSGSLVNTLDKMANEDLVRLGIPIPDATTA